MASGPATLVLELDESGLVTGAKVATKSLDGVKKAGNEAKKSTGGISKAFDSIGSSAKDAAVKGLGPLGGVAEALGGSFGGAALAIGGGIAVVGGLAYGVKALVDSMKPLEDAQRVFRLKDGDEGIARLKEIRKFGSEAGLGLEATTELATKLGTAFKSTSTAEEAFKVISDLKAIVPTVDIGSLTDDFVELAAKTTVGAGDLEKFKKKLGSTAPTFEQIGQASGQSIKQVEDAVKKGTLSASSYAAALRLAAQQAAKTGEAGQAALDLSKTDPTAQITRLGDSLTTLKETFATALLGPDGGAGAIGGVASAIGELANNKDLVAFVTELGQGFATLGKAVLDGAVTAFNALKPIIGPIFTALGKLASNGALVKDVLIGIGIYVAVINAPIIAVTAAVIGLAAAGAYLVNHWTEVVNYFTSIPDDFAFVFDSIGTSISTFVSNVPTMIIGMLKAIGSAFTEFIGLGPGLGSDLVQGIVDGITALANSPVEAITKMAQNAVGAFKSILGIHSPSKVFGEMGANTVEGFTNEVDAGQQQVSTSTSGLATAAIQGAQSGAGIGGLSAPTGGAGGSGGITIEWNGDIIVGAGADASTVAQLGSQVKAMMKDALISLLHETGLSAAGAT